MLPRRQEACAAFPRLREAVALLPWVGSLCGVVVMRKELRRSRKSKVYAVLSWGGGTHGVREVSTLWRCREVKLIGIFICYIFDASFFILQLVFFILFCCSNWSTRGRLFCNDFFIKSF